ncbi:MAG: hypothetical protein ABIK93_07235 [candidate division WOR-3 bacterium]
MAIGFAKYRIAIEELEAEVHKLLCELGVPTAWFASYKAFIRQRVKILKRYYGSKRWNGKIATTISHWVNAGLKQDVLLQLKDKTITSFVSMLKQGMV